MNSTGAGAERVAAHANDMYGHTRECSRTQRSEERMMSGVRAVRTSVAVFT